MDLPRRSLIAGLPLSLAGCGAPDAPLTLAPQVDLDRYFGRWWIIANIPYFAERGNTGAYVEYYRRPDGDIARRLGEPCGFEDRPVLGSSFATSVM